MCTFIPKPGTVIVSNKIESLKEKGFLYIKKKKPVSFSTCASAHRPMSPREKKNSQKMK